MNPMKAVCLLLAYLLTVSAYCQDSATTQKPRLTLDEAFDYVQIQSVAISPDGSAVAIGTRRANWLKERFDRTLWLYRNGVLQPLTAQANDHDPVWSPDGHWIAFLSSRAEEAKGTQVYLISATGGEAFPVTHEEDGFDAFAWSPDSQTLYFAAKSPMSNPEQEAHKKQWHDVIQFREDERGDVIQRQPISSAIASRAHAQVPGPGVVTALNEAVSDMAVSPDGTQLAFTTASPSGRIEQVSDSEIYLVPTHGGTPLRLTRNEARERDVQWSADGRSLFFHLSAGSIEGKYEEVQGRIYSLDLVTRKTERQGASFQGSLSAPAMLPGGEIATTGTLGTEVQLYARQKNAELEKIPGWAGSYAMLSAAAHSRRLAFVFSAQQKPGEVYLAETPEDLRKAKPITAFNSLFTQRALPQGRPYTWTAEDGTKIEGWLVYPPGKFGATHLRMLTLIHGGPGAADGNHFRSDWYDWAVAAAGSDWLVFRPNYRGSIGYGDSFTREISPHLVSRPGKDILAGVDALVRDGIADPDRLTIGGL